MYFFSDTIAQNFQELGFPDYFRLQLGVAKLVGATLLLIPFSGRIKEWIYAGFTINLISASIAHTVTGHPIHKILIPLAFLILLVLSYEFGHKTGKI
jgi:hypothetical protein